MGYRSVPREFVDPPSFWNPTVGLFLGGYALAVLTIWGWFVAASAPAGAALYGLPGTAPGRDGDP